MSRLFSSRLGLAHNSDSLWAYILVFRLSSVSLLGLWTRLATCLCLFGLLGSLDFTPLSRIQHCINDTHLLLAPTSWGFVSTLCLFSICGPVSHRLLFLGPSASLGFTSLSRIQHRITNTYLLSASPSWGFISTLCVSSRLVDPPRLCVFGLQGSPTSHHYLGFDIGLLTYDYTTHLLSTSTFLSRRHTISPPVTSRDDKKLPLLFRMRSLSSAGTFTSSQSFRR